MTMDKENLDILEEYIKNLDIDLANLEKIGAAFLIFGYTNYIKASQIDILELLNMNDDHLNPSAIILWGQKFVFLGYLILFIVSTKRLNEKQLESSIDNETDLSPYSDIKVSYLISIFANALRLSAFERLYSNIK